jgi:hypothetical protein
MANIHTGVEAPNLYNTLKRKSCRCCGEDLPPGKPALFVQKGEMPDYGWVSVECYNDKRNVHHYKIIEDFRMEVLNAAYNAKGEWP